MEYFIGSPEDAEPTAEELGLKSPIAKQVYGLSRKVRELQGQLKEKDQRIAELEDRLAEMADMADEQLDDLVAYIVRLQVGLSIKRRELSDDVTNCTEGLHVPAKMMPDGLVLCQNCAMELSDDTFMEDME